MTAGPAPGNGIADASLTTVEAYQAAVLAAISPLPAVSLELADAEGCVLAEDVMAAVSLPPFDNSSMDGYAVQASDTHHSSERTPATLPVRARPLLRRGTKRTGASRRRQRLPSASP